MGKGLDRATIGLLGLERTLPALAKFGTWALGAGEAVLGLAEEKE